MSDFFFGVWRGAGLALAFSAVALAACNAFGVEHPAVRVATVVLLLGYAVGVALTLAVSWDMGTQPSSTTTEPK